MAALAVRGQTLATAESLTGGLVGAAITSVPGASAVYLGGVISYATPMKTVLAGVSPDVLAAHGPVAGATAIAMAAGVRERTGADWALATTGVAGPDPQDGHAPGLASSRHLHLSGGRDAIRAAAVAAALELLCNLADGVA